MFSFVIRGLCGTGSETTSAAVCWPLLTGSSQLRTALEDPCKYDPCLAIINQYFEKDDFGKIILILPFC